MAASLPLALYIHWPFCVSKCPYCDFNSHVRDEVDQAAWRTALLADLAHEAALTKGRTLGSIFFGGGTPSLMDPATVAALIDAAAGHWALAPDIEAAIARHGISHGVSAISLARHVQAVLQGAFIMAKTANEAAIARDSVAHLKRYILMLFGRG